MPPKREPQDYECDSDELRSGEASEVTGISAEVLRKLAKRGDLAGVRRAPSGFLYTRQDLPRQASYRVPKGPARMIQTDQSGWVPGSLRAYHHTSPERRRRRSGEVLLILRPDGSYEWTDTE